MSEESELTVLQIEKVDETSFQESKRFLTLAQGWAITSPESAIEAGEDLKKVKSLAKELESNRKTITQPINKALREINSRYKPAKEWLAEAERILKDKILGYQQEQARIAQEAQHEANEKAEREREKRERKARLVEIIGMEDKAEELREEAAKQTAPKIESAAPKIEGVSQRVTWKAEITDKMALLRHIVEADPELHYVVKIDQRSLDANASALQETMNIPGVRAVKETSIVARAGS